MLVHNFPIDYIFKIKVTSYPSKTIVTITSISNDDVKMIRDLLENDF